MAPQGPVEEVLASLYAQILGVDGVSAADSFFELGGDSLSAMRLIAAANTTLHTDLHVADIFDTPTITTLAHRIDTQAQPATIPPIQTLRTGTGTPLFCIHATSGISWPYQTLATHLTNPLIGINQTLNADETPPHTLQAMAHNYATRIQNTHPTGPYYLLGWSFGGVLAHQIAIELHHRGHTDTRLILLDSLPTLDTNTNPTTTPRNDHQTLQTLLGHHHTTIPDDQLHHLTTNHNNNITLYQHHQPHTYTGPTLLIAAEHTPPPNHPPYESTHTKAAYLLHAWQPHLTGPTTTHSTNSTHHQLLHPNHTPTYTNHLKNFLQ
nr:thioesterase domain-containing protein [Mycobacterium marinum]